MCFSEDRKGNEDWIVGELLDYLRDDTVRYAIAIEGEWGSGKTRFLKTKFRDELKKSELEMKIVFVSLFGVSDAADLHRRIAAALLPLGTSDSNNFKMVLKQFLKNAKGMLTNAAQLLGYPLKFDLRIDQEALVSFLLRKGCVLVLDDMERRGRDCDDASLFGAVNDLVENKGVKTVLVSNSFLPERSDCAEAEASEDGGRKRNFDSEIKDKLVWRCLRFSPNIDSSVREIFSDHLSKSGGDEKTTVIVRATRRVDCNNIRPLLKSKKFINDLLRADNDYSGNAARKNRDSALEELIAFALLICLGRKPSRPDSSDFANGDYMRAMQLQVEEDQHQRFSSFRCFGDYFDESAGPSVARLSEEYQRYLEKWYPENDDTVKLTETTNAFRDIAYLTDAEADSLMTSLCDLVSRKDFAVGCIPMALVTYFELTEIGFEGSLNSESFVDCCSEVISNNPGVAFDDLDRMLRFGQDGPCKNAMDRLKTEAFEIREREMTDIDRIDPNNAECGKQLASMIEGILGLNPRMLQKIDADSIIKVFAASSPDGQNRICELFRKYKSLFVNYDDDDLSIWLDRLLKGFEDCEDLDKMGAMRRNWLVQDIRCILEK